MKQCPKLIEHNLDKSLEKELLIPEVFFLFSFFFFLNKNENKKKKKN